MPYGKKPKRLFFLIFLVSYFYSSSTIADALVIEITKSNEQEQYETGDVNKSILTSSVQTISEESILDSTLNLSNILENNAGIQIRNSSGQGSLSLASIRGKSSDQIHVYVDGILINSGNGNGVDLSLIPTSGIESVEIYKDFVPIQFSQSSIGGVINLKTKRSQKNKSKISLGYGSFGTRKFNSTLRTSKDKWNLILLAEHLQANNDYSLSNGKKMVSNQIDQNYIQMNTRYSINNNQSIQLSSSYFEKEQGVPPNFYHSSANTLLTQNNWKSKIKWIFNNTFNDKVNSYVEVSNNQKYYEYDDSNASSGLKPLLSEFSSSTSNSRYYSEFSSHNFQWLNHVNLSYEKFDHDDILESQFDKTGNRLTSQFGSQINYFYQNKKIIISPAIRWTHINDNVSEIIDVNGSGTNNLNQTYQNFSPQIGFRFQSDSNYVLKSNLAKSSRTPSFVELYGARGLLSPNSKLKPETGINFDLGFEWNYHPYSSTFTKFNIQPTIFFTQFDNEIVYTFNSQSIGRPVNISSSSIKGIETQLLFEFFYNIELISNTTYLQPNSKKIGSVEVIPPGKSTFMQTLKLQYVAKNKMAYIEGQWEKGMYFDLANVQPAPQKKLANIGVSTKFNEIKITLEGKNIFNHLYQNYFYQPAPGRSFITSISYQF